MKAHQTRPLSIEKQETGPLKVLEREGEHPANVSLQAYLDFYQLEWRSVARAAGLMLVVGWKMVHNMPVSTVHAARMRATLYRLTGSAYTGPIRTYPLEMWFGTQPASQGSAENAGGSR